MNARVLFSLLLLCSCGLAPLSTEDLNALDPARGGGQTCGACGTGQVCDPSTQSCVAAATLSGGVVSACTGIGISARVTIGGWSTCSTSGKAYFQLGQLLPGGPQRIAVGKQGYESASADLTLESGFNTVAEFRLTPVGGCGAAVTDVACACTTETCQ